MFFSSLKEYHNCCCPKKYKWIGSPYIDGKECSVSAYKFKKCGIVFFALYNCYKKNTIAFKEQSEFMEDKEIQNIIWNDQIRRL